MKKKIFTQIIFIMAMVLFHNCLVNAQTPFNPFDWYVYNNSYSYDDSWGGCYTPFDNNQPKSSVLLSSGELVVAGTVTIDNDPQHVNSNCYTRLLVSKYNSSGQVTASYHSNNNVPGTEWNVNQIVATINNDLYVLGTRPSGFVLIKLNSSLAEQWKLPVYTLGEIFIDADNGGNVIAAYTKSDTSSVSGKAIIVRKYNAVDGSVAYTKWLKDMNDANIGSLRDLKVDSNGNSYICGSVYSTNLSSRYLTAKFDNQGNYKWSKYYDAQSFTTDDVANAIVIDHNQNVIVTGESFKNTTNLDVATIKYNSNGVVQWKKRSDNDSINNSGNLIKVDYNNNIYVTGYSGGSTVFLKYNSNGQQIKKRNFPNTVIYSLAVSSQGICYLGGTKICNSVICPDFPFASLASLRKINTSGLVEWIYTSQGYGTQTGHDEFFKTVLVNDVTNEAWFVGALHENYQLQHNYSWNVAFISSALRIGNNYLCADELSIYPNPAKDQLQLTFNNDFENAVLTFFDLQGREVMNKTITSNDETINVSELKPGLYVARIVYNGNVINKKFVKE